MILRQLFDYETWTYTYLVADEASKDAVLIDPVLSQIDRDVTLIEELGLNLIYALDTHVHADHVTAAGHLRDRLGCKTAIAGGSGVECADVALKDEDILSLGRYEIKVIATPGHTSGCLSFYINGYVFTGDSLFIRGCGRTDFQQGDSALLYRSITQRLYVLPDETVVCPGHDYNGRTISTIGEEKAFNPRIRLGKEKFIDYMNNLNLPDPKLIMEAVPSNQSCGQV